MLFAGLGSVRMVKNCDLGPENAALGLRPRAAFSSPRSQFFTIRTSQPANNIYISSDTKTSRDHGEMPITTKSQSKYFLSLRDGGRGWRRCGRGLFQFYFYFVVFFFKKNYGRIINKSAASLWKTVRGKFAVREIYVF